MLGMSSLVKTHLEESSKVKIDLFQSDQVEEIVKAANWIANAQKNDCKLMICGNGGSAADAQHIAAEFTNVLSSKNMRPGLAAIALTTDTSFITAHANDFGFDGIFKRQVQALGRVGDVLLGISTSGHSTNVEQAVAFCKVSGMKTVLLTGQDGGSIGSTADIVIKVPSDNIQYIQEAHIAIGHIICKLVEKEHGYAG